MSRWQRYWFEEGGRRSVAILRIAIAFAVLLSIIRLSTLNSIVAPAGLYRPVGIWMLLGRSAPPELLVDLLWVLAFGGTLCMLVGLGTRAATAVSFVASVALAAISFSHTQHWSHQYNVVFLAQLAFLGARGGDTLSLDAVIRRLRGLPEINVPRGYQWSLRLVQLAVALMFAGAVFYKLLHGHGTLRWALSDNLRHHLLVRYDLAGLDRPALVDWIIDDVWRYRTAAVLNMVTQLMPIFACIFARRPWVRAACGALFTIETLALGLVVSLWNLHWLPLVAVFLDWDALEAWIRARLHRPLPPPPATPPAWQPPRGVRIFIVAFLVYDLLTAFIPTLDQRLNTYPFSGFPMFATIRATPPYDEHHPYYLAGDRIEVIGNVAHKFAQRWLDHSHRGMFRERNPDKLKERLARVLARAPAHYPDVRMPGLRAFVAFFVAPAYPARAHFERHNIAITGELLPDGTFRTLLGTLKGNVLEMRPRGIDTTTAKLVAYRNDRPEPIEVVAKRDGDRFELTPVKGKPVYYVAVIDGTPWLVASKP